MCRLAELLLKKETLSLPDIVDTLGERPYAVKESVMEYLTELRARQDVEDDVRSEEEAQADAKRKEAIDATKFDPDAEEGADAAASAAKNDTNSTDSSSKESEDVTTSDDATGDKNKATDGEEESKKEDNDKDKKE